MKKFLPVMASVLVIIAYFLLPEADLSLSGSGESLNYVTQYLEAGMTRDLYGGFEPEQVAEIFDCLQEAVVREVNEPLTEHGAVYRVDDYYMELFVLGFYEEEPTLPESAAEAPISDYDFKFYGMAQGEPEFGEDSRYLLYDVAADKWFVFSDGRVNRLRGLLAKGETLLD